MSAASTVTSDSARPTAELAPRNIGSDLTSITNEQGKHLGDRFGVLLGDDTRFFDCLVGYFFISGFHRLHPSLTKTEKVRILVGIKTEGATYELIQTAKQQQEFVLESHAQVRERVPGEILAEFQKSVDSAQIEDGVRKFVEWIRSGKLEVRAYPSVRVGMMTEIIRARCALTPYFNDFHERTPYHFKRHAIQNCLYGVDKQRDAEADTSALQREIDELVYALYGLTPEEKALVQAAAK